MRRVRFAAQLLWLALGACYDARLVTAESGEAAEPTLRVNHLQVAATHNSFHLEPDPLFHPSHAYSHLPLDEQLEGGIRAVELDLHAEGGELLVYHIAFVDAQTTCARFVECLTVMQRWSAAHPRHVPIVVWIEIKNDTGGDGIGDAADVDRAIEEVLTVDQLITPADLQAHYAAPRARIDAEGWPLLNDVRGRFLFVLFNKDELAEAYTHGYASLADRLMFVNTPREHFGRPWAVVTKLRLDDAINIGDALDRNMLVSSDTCAADLSDAACSQRRDTAVTYGVHMLQDDLPFPVSGREYALTLPAGSPGCNPVTAPAGCDASLLE